MHPSQIFLSVVHIHTKLMSPYTVWVGYRKEILVSTRMVFHTKISLFTQKRTKLFNRHLGKKKENKINELNEKRKKPIRFTKACY